MYKNITQKTTKEKYECGKTLNKLVNPEFHSTCKSSLGKHPHWIMSHPETHKRSSVLVLFFKPWLNYKMTGCVKSSE